MAACHCYAEGDGQHLVTGMHKVTIALILVVVVLLLLEQTFFFFEFSWVDTSPQSHRQDFSK
jgi:hypothetical protein